MANMDPTRPIEKENAMSLSKSEQSDMSNLCHNLVNTVPRMSLPVDYKLNQKIALQKKLTACDRTPFTVKHNKISTTTTMNTVVFEYFRTYIEHYLTHIKKYKVEIVEAPDKCGAITKDIVRVFENSTHLYTINLHTTTSRVMINGPKYARFTEEDMPVIMEKIIEMTENVGNTSSITKHHIELRLAELDPQQLPRRKQLSSKKHEEGMERKEYPSRRTTQITESTNRDTFDIPIEIVEEIRAPPVNNTTADRDAIEDINANTNIDHHDTNTDNTAHEKANDDVATNTEMDDTNGNTDIINDKINDHHHHVTTANEITESTTTVKNNELEENMLDEFIFKTLATLVARELVHNVLTYTVDQQKKQIDEDILENCPTLTHQAQTYTTNQATEKVRRSSRQTKATEKVKQSKVNDKKVIRAKRKRQESESEKIDERCPKCMEMVEEGSDGIVCETCVAYWHYSCADVNEEMVTRMQSNKEEFFCVKHKPSSTCSQTNLDTVISAPADDKSETTLKNKTTMLEKEIKKSKLTNGEETNYKAELKKKNAEIQKLTTEIEDIKANHNKILDQKQITLDSLGNTIATMKKERTKIQIELRTHEKKNIELENEIKNRLEEIKRLKADNMAHVEFARANIITNDSVGQCEELQKENKQLKEKIAQCEKQITENLKNSEKVVDKNREIKQLKTQISSLEERIGELHNANQQCVRELNVNKADLEREKDLNTLLNKKNSEEAAKNDKEAEVKVPNPRRQAKRNNRGLCWHEVLQSDSCPFANCMFSHHDVSADDRQNEQIRAQALRNKANAPPRGDFQASQMSKRSPCHYFVLDMCRRGDRCRFSHDTSKFPPENHTQKAKQYIESRKARNTNHPNWQQHNTSIADGSEHQNPNSEQQANLTHLYQYDDQRAKSSKPVSPLTSVADHVSTHQSSQQNVLHTQPPPPQPQQQLQPPHDDSFLLLVRSMIQEQINQQITPSTLQIPTYYAPQQMFPVM